MNQIPLTKGLTSVVSVEDYEYLSQWRWKALSNGCGLIYAARTNKTGSKHKHRTDLMHRLIAERMGLTVEGKDIDHVNRDPLDNRRENIRVATRAQNKRNSAVMQSNSSGFKGVSWHKWGNKWRAYISIDGKQKSLGSFASATEAARAHDQIAAEVFGVFACTNDHLHTTGIT